MSFREFKDKIDYGDTVFLHVGYDNMLPIVVKKGATHQTKFGALRHDNLVGKAFGARFQCSRGWIYPLHPTPELWTISLPHRTQILYSTDISMILLQLDLAPGSVVVESGTGSGSLSHAIARTVLPHGHLHTFEFHEERSQKAREEFKTHGLTDYVTVTHRDVCGDGFQLDHIADAVFLDLPKPWDCMTSAKQALKLEGGRLSSFSPCIEQVQRSCDELHRLGFTDISTIECLSRNYNINYAKLQNLTFEPGQVDPASKVAKSDTQGSERSKPAQSGDGTSCFTTAVPAIGMQGHTGFLTFATLPVQDIKL